VCVRVRVKTALAAASVVSQLKDIKAARHTLRHFRLRASLCSVAPFRVGHRVTSQGGS
jgi:hypothetical protein